MFVETITTPHDEWERWNGRLRLLSEPPAALIASIAWQTKDGNVSAVSVWESPEAVADFFMERVRPFVEVEGSPATTPTRHGEPIGVYLRGDRTS